MVYLPTQTPADADEDSQQLVIVDDTTERQTPGTTESITAEQRGTKRKNDALDQPDSKMPKRDGSSERTVKDMMETSIWLNASKSKRLTVGYHCRAGFPVFISFCGKVGEGVYLNPVELRDLSDPNFVLAVNSHMTSPCPTAKVKSYSCTDLGFETINGFPVLTFVTRGPNKVFVRLGKATWDVFCNKMDLIWTEVERLESMRAVTDRWMRAEVENVVLKKYNNWSDKLTQREAEPVFWEALRLGK